MDQRIIGLGLLIGIAGATTTAQAAESFESFNPGFGTSVFSITPDGKTAVGVTDGGVFRWVRGSGATFISDFDWMNTFTAGVTDDGKTVVSSMLNPENGRQEASIWREGSGWQFMGGLTEGVDTVRSTAWDISGDGSKTVGLAWHPNYRAEAYLQTDIDGWLGLGQPVGASSRATKISRDGSTIVGFYENPDTGERRSARWVNGGAADLFLSDGQPGEAMATSSDGSIIVGSAWVDSLFASYAFIFDANGYQNLGALPNQSSNIFPRSMANGVSDNGIVVGWSGGAGWMGDIEEGFVWTATGGMVGARAYLEHHGVTIPSDLHLNSVTSISADGKTFGGQAYNRSTGLAEAWIATAGEAVPEPASMAALAVGALALIRRRRQAA